MVQSGWWPSIFGFSAPSCSLAFPPCGNRRHVRGLTRPGAPYHHFRERARRRAGFVSARAWAHFGCVITACSSPDGRLSIESISGENALRRSDGKTERLLGIYSSVMREKNHKGSFFFHLCFFLSFFLSSCLFAFLCFYYFSHFSLLFYLFLHSFFFACSSFLSFFLPVFFL